MAVHVLPEAREDLGEAVRYYRGIRPAAIGRLLAARVLAAFRDAARSIAEAPFARPEHPDIPGGRFVQMDPFPYLVFYALEATHVVIVAVEHARRDYVVRITKRLT